MNKRLDNIKMQGTTVKKNPSLFWVSYQATTLCGKIQNSFNIKINGRLQLDSLNIHYTENI